MDLKALREFHEGALKALDEAEKKVKEEVPLVKGKFLQEFHLNSVTYKAGKEAEMPKDFVDSHPGVFEVAKAPALPEEPKTPAGEAKPDA